MTTKIFNPAQFAASQEDQTPSTPKAEAKDYKLTGNSSRDQVRKMLYEIFAEDEFPKKTIASLIEAIEDQISTICPDPKAKQYRDTSRALQTKLKGSRFQELRSELLRGSLSVEEVCSDDFLNGKRTVPPTQLKTAPVAHAPSSLGARPVPGRGPPGGRGAPGQLSNPRGAPAMFRPQQMGQIRPIMPIQSKLPMQIPRMSPEPSEQPEPSAEVTQTEADQDQSQVQQSQADHHQREESKEEATPRRSEVELSQNPMTPPRQKQHFESTNQMTPIHQNQPSNHQALIDDEPPRTAIDLNQTQINNETVFQSFVEPSAQDLTVEQSVEMSYEVSQDQINLSSHGADLPPKAKKKKKGKKKKHTEDYQQSILAELGQQQAEQQQNFTIPVLNTVQELTDASQQHSARESANSAKPEMVANPVLAPIEPEPTQPTIIVEEAKEEQPVCFWVPPKPSSDVPEEAKAHSFAQPQQMTLGLSQQSLPQHVLSSPSGHVRRQQISDEVLKVSGGSSDVNLNTLIQENARLRQQIRTQNVQEDTFIQQQHQISLLQAQLKGRDEQLVSLRWQMQQAQSQYQKEIDELHQRLKRTHLESQQYRDLMSQQRSFEHVQQPAYVLQTFVRPQQQQHDEMMADRGSNNTAAAHHPTFNQHGGTTDAGTQQEANVQLHLDSGEQDEGVRDDGHFYRQETTDEGTGGAGFSLPQQLQRNIVDVSSSGGGQMQSNNPYQRMELYENQPLDDYGDDDDQAYPDQDPAAMQQTQNNHQSQMRQHILQPPPHAKSSSGSAFGEGNNQQDAQDDSEEEGGMMGGMGMMGNRQGSSHHVEDDSGGGHLEIVAQSSSVLAQSRKNLFGANNQSEELQEPQQHQHVSKMHGEDQEGEQQNSSEEGGEFRNSIDGGDNDSEGDLSSKQQLVEPVDDTPDYFSSHHMHGTRDMDVESVHSHFAAEADQPQHQSNLVYEEEKEEPQYSGQHHMSQSLGPMQQHYGRTAAIISDNVERPQPYHPRQQQQHRMPATQAPTLNVSGGGSAVLTSANSMVYPQHAHMQGESIQNKRDSGVAQQFPKPKSTIGGVAVVSRSQRVDTNNSQANPQNQTNSGNVGSKGNQNMDNSMQSGDRPGGQPQRRGNGNKQQLQVPPLPPNTSQTSTGQSSNTRQRDSKGQGQGGGVVNQSQSSSQTRNQGRNSRGTQRNNHQQQIFANTPSSGNTQITQAAQEQSPPRIAQVLRPPASQASSAAQLPFAQQQKHTTSGGASGNKSKFTKPDSYQDTSSQNYQNNQQEGINPQVSGASLQASTMPASQASFSGSGSSVQQQHHQRQQSHQQQHASQSSSSQQMPQQQNTPAIATTRYEGVVHTAGQQMSQSQASNTQALGGAMMGSSGSGLINTSMGGDMGGGAMDRQNVNNGSNSNLRSGGNNTQQMNMETGSTTEFSGSHQNKQSQWHSQAHQQVSSPPSTSQSLRQNQFQSQQAAHHYLQDQDHISASGGGEVDPFVQSLGVTPLAQQQTTTAKSAIQSTSHLQFYPPPQQQPQRQQNNLQQSYSVPRYAQQPQSYLIADGVADSASSEPNQLNTMMVSSGGAASQTPLNQGESGANAQVMSRNTQQQQVQQAYNDSQKTSGANTPSKDGANTPTYREQIQQNNSQIFNLTSMRLQGLHQQQQQNQQHQPARMQSASYQPQVEAYDFDAQLQQMNAVSGQQQPRNTNVQSSSGGESAIIPRTIFE